MKKVLMAFFFCLLFSVSVQAKDVLPTDKTTAGEGCTLVGLEGKYIADAQKALDRINEIRYEACEEGVWKQDIYGNPTTEKLTLADYKPIKWSSDLEYIARIRAAEATVVLDHDRPNGEVFRNTTLYSNGERSWGENLAWNGGQSILAGIEQWYNEKSDWIDKTGKVTGHYTSMINPRYSYVAVAAFFNPNAVYKNATSAEFSDRTDLDETMNEMNGECIQTIEVKDEYLSLNLSLDKTDIKIGENAQVKATAIITNPSPIMNKKTCEASLQGDVTWSSSNEKVAKVDKYGKITGVDEGTATITATSGTLSKTITIKVTGHAWGEGQVTTAPECEKEGVRTYTCTVCGKTKTDPIAATGHEKTEVRGAKEATCTEEGYTGDSYCVKCGKKLSTGTKIEKKAHSWDKGTITTAPTYKKAGIKTYTCKVCGAKKTETISKLALPKTGTVYTIAGNQYKITKAGAEVSLIKTSVTAKTVTIPATISVKGLTYKVTTIGAKAFKQNKKLNTVTIGVNVRSISNNAFFKCPSLKTTNIKTVLLTNKTASKKAFKGTNKKLVIKVPKKVKKTYQKIFKGIKVK